MFGRGSLQILSNDNRHVLAFLRRFHDQIVIVVSNLSASAQTVAIEWPAGLELVASERDRHAPRLVEIESSLPFVYPASLGADARSLD